MASLAPSSSLLFRSLLQVVLLAAAEGSGVLQWRPRVEHHVQATSPSRHYHHWPRPRFLRPRYNDSTCACAALGGVLCVACGMLAVDLQRCFYSLRYDLRHLLLRQDIFELLA